MSGERRARHAPIRRLVRDGYLSPFCSTRNSISRFYFLSIGNRVVLTIAFPKFGNEDGTSMISLTKNSICFGALFVANICPINASPSAAHEFELNLRPLNYRVKQGTVPEFRLTLKNVSHESQKILDLENRIDFEFPYYHLIVTRKGKQVDIPSVIWDPGPISSRDWIVILPGKTKTFNLTEFAECFEKLPPGIYQAHVEFWRDPFQTDRTAYPSESVTFEVTK